MRNFLIPFFIVAVCVMVNGCALLQQQQQFQPVAVEAIAPSVRYTEATLTPGKTTKTEVIKIFGAPDDFSDRHNLIAAFPKDTPAEMINSASAESLTYFYHNRPRLEAAKIRYIQRDGTEYGIILQAGTKKTFMTLNFNRNGILLDASFH